MVEHPQSSTTREQSGLRPSFPVSFIWKSQEEKISLNRDPAPLYQTIPCQTPGLGCSRLACRPSPASLTKAPCSWSTDQPRTSSRETSTHCGGTSACPKGKSPASPAPCALLRGYWHIAARRTLPAAGAGSRAQTEQRQVPPGIKPHSQLWLHMLPHQHQPLVTNWLCCPE